VNSVAENFEEEVFRGCFFFEVFRRYYASKYPELGVQAREIERRKI